VGHERPKTRPVGLFDTGTDSWERGRLVRRIVGIVCASLLVLGVGLFFLRNTPPTFNWADAGCTVANAPDRTSTPVSDTVVCFPNADASASEYRNTAQQTCEREGVRPLAVYLDARLRGPRPVARKYVRWMRAPGGRLSRTSDATKLRAVYEGCLQGFRERT